MRQTTKEKQILYVFHLDEIYCLECAENLGFPVTENTIREKKEDVSLFCDCCENAI